MESPELFGKSQGWLLYLPWKVNSGQKKAFNRVFFLHTHVCCLPYAALYCTFQMVTVIRHLIEKRAYCCFWQKKSNLPIITANCCFFKAPKLPLTGPKLPLTGPKLLLTLS